MDQKWIHILVMLVLFYQNVAGEDRTVTEGQRVDITCNPTKGTMIIWFRVLDQSSMEFIGSFSNNGLQKVVSSSFSSTFSSTKIGQNILTLQSFKKATDSGVYGCASLYKGSELKFGAVTRLVGENTIRPQVATTTPTTKQNLCTTATPCVCKDHNQQEETSLDIFCTPLILGPLAGGCGLLLLLLIITIMYCNKIRTQRCPHHYKRKPRVTAAGKQMMTNRDI